MYNISHSRSPRVSPLLCLCPIMTVGLLLLHPTPPFVFLPTKDTWLPQIFPNQTFHLRWLGRSNTLALSAQAMRRARRRPRHCPGQGRLLLVPLWRHDLYWFLCRDYFFCGRPKRPIEYLPPMAGGGGPHNESHRRGFGLLGGGFWW
jgi:hypothetical protein